MSDLIPFAAACAVAFSFLLLAPLGLSTGLWGAGRLLKVQLAASPPRWADLRSHARFAALWSILGFVPLAALVRMAGPAEPRFPWAFAGFGVAAFLLAFRSRRLASDPPGGRLAWAGLEALLVAEGFLLFEGALDLTRAFSSAAV